MDYKGQRDCEYYYYLITLIFGVCSWLYGFYYQNFRLTVNGWLIGTLITVVVSIPDWPFYNRNKVIWADEVDKEIEKINMNQNKNSKGKNSSSR